MKLSKVDFLDCPFVLWLGLEPLIFPAQLILAVCCQWLGGSGYSGTHGFTYFMIKTPFQFYTRPNLTTVAHLRKFTDFLMMRTYMLDHFGEPIKRTQHVMTNF